MDKRKSKFYSKVSKKRGYSFPIVNSIPPMPPTKPPRKEEEPEKRSEKSNADTSINDKGYHI